MCGCLWCPERIRPVVCSGAFGLIVGCRAQYPGNSYNVSGLQNRLCRTGSWNQHASKTGFMKMISSLKSFLKLTVCHILFYSGLINVYLRWKFAQMKEFPAVILTYHSFVY